MDTWSRIQLTWWPSVPDMTWRDANVAAPGAGALTSHGEAVETTGYIDPLGLVGLVVGAFLLWGVGVAVLLAGLSSVAVGVALERQRKPDVPADLRRVA